MYMYELSLARGNGFKFNHINKYTLTHICVIIFSIHTYIYV